MDSILLIKILVAVKSVLFLRIGMSPMREDLIKKHLNNLERMLEPLKYQQNKIRKILSS